MVRGGAGSAVRDAHEAFLERGGTAVAPDVSEIVASSWLRSLAAGVNADASQPPITIGSQSLADYRAQHPLAPVYPLLRDVLSDAAAACDSVLAVTDEGGQLLWVSGAQGALRRAEKIAFVEGALWDEEHAGTNAPGTALRLDLAVAIRAAEHFVRPVQRWNCAAAPVHDPLSRRVLGVVDITGGRGAASPQTMAMVRAAARMAEAELARIAALGGPHGAGGRSAASSLAGSGGGPGSGSPAQALHVQALGRPDCVLTCGGRSIRLSPRHSEILMILAHARDGISGDELTALLYPGDITTSTPRAELVRLRGLLGADLLRSRPYRIGCEVTSDWATVQAALAVGDVAQALRLYRGPLLPFSESPQIVRMRDDLHDWLRSAVLADGRPRLLVEWTQSRLGADDLGAWQRQCQVLPAGSPLRVRAEAAAARIDAELSR